MNTAPATSPLQKDPAHRTRVLVVDDEPVVTEVVQRYLAREGYDVVTAADGEAALKVAREWTPHLIVLDLMLPRMDGLEVCRAVRKSSMTPIVMLTAKGEEVDRVLGLETGADDYVVKPFSPRELVARVKAVLRRAETSRHNEGVARDSVKLGGLTINPRMRSVEANGRQVELTVKEFDLLHYLASRPGEVFTREQLMTEVWDYAFAGDSSTVTVHMRRLREKIEPDPARPKWLKTVWGVGYKFEAA
jgi:DNA-binding response OmpR family regulator